MSSSIPSVAAGPTPLMPLPQSRGAKAAREFEATLVSSLAESMEKTFANLPGEDQVPGSDNYNYLGTHALGEAIASRGGFGIAKFVSEHLPLHEGKG